MLEGRVEAGRPVGNLWNDLVTQEVMVARVSVIVVTVVEVVKPWLCILK